MSFHWPFKLVVVRANTSVMTVSARTPATAKRAAAEIRNILHAVKFERNQANVSRKPKKSILLPSPVPVENLTTGRLRGIGYGGRKT